MRIFVHAKPGARKEYVRETTDLFEKSNERRFVVAVSERATNGNANRAIERAIAGYLGIAASRVRIVAGQTARKKTVEVV